MKCNIATQLNYHHIKHYVLESLSASSMEDETRDILRHDFGTSRGKLRIVNSASSRKDEMPNMFLLGNSREKHGSKHFAVLLFSLGSLNKI